MDFSPSSSLFNLNWTMMCAHSPFSFYFKKKKEGFKTQTHIVKRGYTPCDPKGSLQLLSIFFLASAFNMLLSPFWFHPSMVSLAITESGYETIYNSIHPIFHFSPFYDVDIWKIILLKDELYFPLLNLTHPSMLPTWIWNQGKKKKKAWI